MRMGLWLCVPLFLVAGTIAAEGKPDFSGRWVLVNAAESASAAARGLVVRESFEAPVTVMTVERRLENGVRSDTYRIGLSGGLVGGTAADGRGTATRFSVTWDGDKLVIETGSYSGPTRESGPYSEHNEVWSLDSQGRLVITVTDRGTATELRTNQLTYRRP
jgi:hypothetical protein